jgi:CRISPR/Cas system-associated endonuclease Cas3-HD
MAKATKKSLKIVRKKKPTKRTKKVRLTVKIKKLSRTLRKAQSLAKKAVKLAIKSHDIKKIPDRFYRRIDSAIAKAATFNDIIDAAVVSAVNETFLNKEPKTPKAPKVKKEREPRGKKTEAAAEAA